MRLYNKSKLLAMLLALSICCTKMAYAQPSFVSPTTCIPAQDTTPVNTPYTVNVPTGTTVTGVQALGDLQIISTSPATFPVVGPTTLTVTVRTKNVGRDTLNTCVGYLNPKTKKFGFGRGVIRVSYTTNGGACANYIDQAINKTFKEKPLIIGPKCISVGDTVTYSVCSILSVNQNANIGIDAYLWNQRLLNTPIAGLTPVYTSGDNSSVTYLVTGAFTGGTLNCKFGVCNYSTDSSTLTLGLKTSPSKINVTSNSVVVATNLANNGSVCVGTKTANNPITLAINTPGSYTFSWSSNNPSWTFTPATGTSVSLNANQSGGIVYVTAVGTCDTRRDTFYINRSLDTPLLIKRTDTITCIPIGSTITFNVNNAANTAQFNNINFVWGAPTGWTINSPANGATVTMTATATAISGNVTVSAGAMVGSSLVCPGTIASLYVRVKPAKPSAITGLTCIPPGPSIQQYSVTAVGGYTYFWQNTALWGLNVAQVAPYNVIKYNATTASGMPNTISVRDTALGGCASDTAQLVVRIAPVAPTAIVVSKVCGTVTNCVPGGLATTVVLTATGGSGTYNWTVPAGFGSIASSADSTVTINCLGNPGTYSGFQVYCTNAPCTQSSTYSTSVTVSPAATVDTSQNVLGGNNDLLKVNLNGGCTPTAYCWRLNNTGSCVGTGSQLLLSGLPLSSYSYTVQISYGTCSRYITQGTRYTTRPVNPNNGNPVKNPLSFTTISPNPAADAFMLVLPAGLKAVSVSVFSSKGELIKKQVCNAGSNKFSTASWPNGEYLIKLTNSKGETETKKLMVSK